MTLFKHVYSYLYLLWIQIEVFFSEIECLIHCLWTYVSYLLYEILYIKEYFEIPSDVFMSTVALWLNWTELCSFVSWCTDQG